MVIIFFYQIFSTQVSLYHPLADNLLYHLLLKPAENYLSDPCKSAEVKYFLNFGRCATSINSSISGWL